jgi:hypothetical protein
MFKWYRTTTVACLLMASAVTSMAQTPPDFFVGRQHKPAFERGDAVPADTRLGGYALPLMGQPWTLLTHKIIQAPSSEIGEPPLPIGQVELLRLGDRQEPLMFLLASANLSTNNFVTHWNGDTCKADAPVLSINQAAGALDRCAVVFIHQVPISGKPAPFLVVSALVNGESGRWLQLTVAANLESTGHPAIKASDWSAQAVAADPAKQQLMPRLHAWTADLLRRVQLAARHNQPADAFVGLEPLFQVVALPSGADRQSAVARSQP